MSDLLRRLNSALAGHYLIERELGRGGMATVYLAQDLRHDRQVAMKLLHPEVAAVLGSERFLREIKVAATLNHPHIMPLFESGEADGSLYYVMPLVSGESLRYRLRGEGQLPIPDALSLTQQVVAALDHAHRRQIIHRDIKPENILIHEGEAMVADFGIALAASRAGGDRLTATGLAVGTPEYMSPEQATGGRAVDGRTDQYSLACVLYEMLVGEPPYTGATAAAILTKRASDPVPSARRLRDTIPHDLDAALRRALSKLPADRFATIAEFGAAISKGDASVSAARALVPPVGEQQAIVVLPFANLSPDPDNEYFSDGLTEEIITDLSQVRALRVISRTSAMQLKRTAKDTRTIGRELNVGYVLEGSVRRAGNHLRVTAQLIEAATDAHLWAEKYSGTLSDVFDMQERLSRQIVDALQLTLTPAEERRIAERPISNLRAYEYYLQARQQIWSFTDASLERALQLIHGAQELVGGNELLYAAEGMIFWQYVNVGLKPVDSYDDYLRKAEACAAKIFELNPESSKGYVLRGSVWNNRASPLAAMQDFKQAVALDPNNPEALLWLAYSYAVSGREPLARPLVDRLLQVDPLTSINVFMAGWLAFMEGHYDEALRWTQHSVDIDPDNPSSRQFFALMLAANGRPDDACALLEDVARDAPRAAWSRMAIAMKHALRGEREAVLRIATPELRSAAWWDDILSWWMACCFALVGEHNAALDCLERAVAFGYINYPFLAERDPFLRSLRGEARFRQLMANVQRRYQAFEA